MSTFKMNPVTHIVFDIDGLLLDTEAMFSDIMNCILRPHGKEFNWDVKRKQMGKACRAAGQVLIDEFDLPITVDDYCDQLTALMKDKMPTCKLMPGAEKLVRHLDAHKVPMSLASGSSKDEYHLKVDALHSDLFSLFQHAVFCGSDPEVKNSKPAPDCYLLAAHRFPDKPDPAQCLVFEDAPLGVEGAEAAGMQVVWVPVEGCDAESHKDRATVTLTSLELFQPEMFGLPAYT